MDRPRSASLAGRPKLSIRRTDGRSQRRSLANNLAANAADMVEAVHCGGEWASAEVASRAGFGPYPRAERPRAKSGSQPTVGGRPQDRPAVWLSCPSHIPPKPLTHTLVRRGDGAVRLGT